MTDERAVEALISIWSMRPPPDSVTGRAWEDGARQGWQWAEAALAAAGRADDPGGCDREATANAFEDGIDRDVDQLERVAKKIGEVAGQHDYLSTACHHGLHERCRKACKFCGVDCNCNCHREGRALAAAGRADASDWVQSADGMETIRENSDAVIRRLIAENAKLRTALKPFADAAPKDGEFLRPVRLVYDPSGDKGSLSPEDFLNARDALKV